MTVHKSKYTKRYRDAGLHNGHRFEVNCAEHAYRELDWLVHSMPHVDADGSSPCPNAEQLYRQLREAECHAKGVLARLNYLSAVIEEELRRSQKAVSELGKTQGRIKATPTKTVFNDVVQREAEHLRQVQIQAQDIGRHAAALRALLHKAAKKQFPGMDTASAAGTPASKGKGK